MAALSSENTRLTTSLYAIRNMIENHRFDAHALAPGTAELWQQSDQALQDCEATLKELSNFVESLKCPKAMMMWRVKFGLDMSIHAGKLEQFRTRLQQCNCALQTILQAIAVSISLQTNASQDLFAVELSKLKSSIEKVITLVTQSSLTASAETQATKNLQGLAKAAECFYSTAATSVGGSVGGSFAGGSIVGGSIAGWEQPARDTGTFATLPPFKRPLLLKYLRDTRQEGIPSTATIREERDIHSTEFPECSIPDSSAQLTETPSILMKTDPDVDFQQRLVGVLEEFAIVEMVDGHFAEAAEHLNRALSGEVALVREPEAQRRLQTRLGICYVLQGKIQEALEVVPNLEASEELEDRELLHLMHAIAIIYLAEGKDAAALDLGTGILNAKIRLLGKSHPETLTSVGFLGDVYDKRKQPLHWEANRRRMPHDYVYSRPENAFDYLAQHSMLMPAIALGSEKAELPGTPFSEDSQSASAQTEEMERASNSSIRRTLTQYKRQRAAELAQYESQRAAELEASLATTVTPPEEEEECPAPEITASTNGQKRVLSRSMTSMRRHLSTWRSSKLATERKEQAVSGNPNIRRSRTVLHKAPRSQMGSSGPTGLARAKRFLGILKTEMTVITVPTEMIMTSTPAEEEILSVFELDSKPIARDNRAKQPTHTDQEQETPADHGAQASMPDVPPSELPRASVRPLDMSLDQILELPEPESGDGGKIVIEDEDNSSEGGISRSPSDNRSTTSGSSYSTNTTVSDVAPASPVDCRDSDSSSVVRSLSQKHEDSSSVVRSLSQGHDGAQLAKNSSLNRSKTPIPSQGKDTLLPFHASVSALNRSKTSIPSYGKDPLLSFQGSVSALNRSKTSIPYHGRDSSLPVHGGTQVLPQFSLGGSSDGSGETHGLKRTVSWRHGDENLFTVRLPDREPQPTNAEAEVLQAGDGNVEDGDCKHRAVLEFFLCGAGSG